MRVLIQVYGTNEFRDATAGLAFDVMTDGCARSRVVAACLVRPENWEKAELIPLFEPSYQSGDEPGVWTSR